MHLSAKGSINRSYEILDANKNTIATVVYPSRFKYRSAEICAGNRMWHTQPAQWLSRRMELLERDTVIGMMKFKGMNTFQLQLTDRPNYTIRRVGFLRSHVGLFTEAGMEIMKVTQPNKWAFRTLELEIETDDNYTEAKDPLILSCVIWYINYLRAAANASA